MLSLFVLMLSLCSFAQISTDTLPVPNWLLKLYSVIERYCVASFYGLFGRMSTFRYEVIIEGSDDLQNWIPYEFLYKPGNLFQIPRFVTGHLPRLDWRLWFCQFDRNRSEFQPPEYWFEKLLLGLLKGSRQINSIIANNSFSTPPKFIRTRLYQYQFETPQDKQQSGRWWKSTFVKEFCPVATLQDEELCYICFQYYCRL